MKTLTAQTLKDIRRKLMTSTLSMLFVFVCGQASATTLNISNVPLDVLEGVPANIILTMDDSGSMAWSFLPTNTYGNYLTQRAKSSVYNKIYYDPNVNYTPAVDKYGASLGDAPFTAAWINGFDQGGSTVDLSTSFRPTWYYAWRTWDSYADPCSRTNNACAEPAYYYIFDSSKTTGGVACDINNSAHVNNSDDCYTKVVVSATSGPGGTDERQNFANWYSYYRIRHLLAKTAATKAFSSLSDAIRISWQALNTSTTVGNTLPLTGTHRTNFFDWLYTVPYSGGTPLRRAMSRAGNKYSQSGTNSPYAKEPGVSGSPEYSCRQNFHFAFTDGEWNSTGPSPWPGNYDNNSHTLPTDATSRYGNINYQPQTTRTADQASPVYRDSNSDYLADIAMYYWARDLRGDLENDVPVYEADTTTDMDNDGDIDNYDTFWNPNNDPAQWQHMVNFFVGLGVNGALDFDGTTTSGTTYDQLLLGSAGGGLDWTNNEIDDMWHAAINSRGKYFSATNPTQLVNAFGSVLSDIDSRSASSSAIATTSSQLLSGAVLFQASYDPGDWSGEIRAYDAIYDFTTKQLQITSKWLGSSILASQITTTGRQIITYDAASETASPFQWGNITAAQQTALHTLNGTNDGLGSQRLGYLRGDNSNEVSNGGSFRNRTSPYADIVHSDPEYVPPPGPPYMFFPDSLESAPYSQFIADNDTRTEMLLFGGNDGMLHILDAQSGRELLAYVPSPVFNRLSNLTDPNYQHQYYVDQTVKVSDVYYNSDWHTVAIGGLGKGGQGLYALDITDPGIFLEANASNIVMWEFTDADDADLGYTFTKPKIMKMNNDKWMVVFGNGYNSTEDDTATGGQQSATGNGIIFMLDVEHGGKGATGLKVKLDTGVGAAQDPTGANRPNRLTDIVAIDINADYKVDYLYAGDLFGNLWKIDVTDSNPGNWEVMGVGNTPKPLFTATDPSGDPQPITLQPEVLNHPDRSGYLVYVGTGKYLENSDTTDTSIQSIYAIWDREESNISTIDRSHLLQQWIDSESNSNGVNDNVTDNRTSTNHTISWYSGNGLPPTGGDQLGWFMDLGLGTSATDPTIATPDGERVDYHLYVDYDSKVVEFSTLIPNNNPCDYGGDGWAYRLNAISGSRFEQKSPWDYNQDGKYDDLDKLYNSQGTEVWGSGIKVPMRIRTTKTRSPTPECIEVNILNYSDGTIGTLESKCNDKQLGRRSWRQIPIK